MREMQVNKRKLTEIMSDSQQTNKHSSYYCVMLNISTTLCMLVQLTNRSSHSTLGMMKAVTHSLLGKGQ